MTSMSGCLNDNGNIKENSLVFFAEKYKILSEKIKHLFTKENIDIISPISAICENHNIVYSILCLDYKINYYL